MMSTHAFQLRVTVREVPGTVVSHMMPSSQEGMAKKTRRPYMRLSQKRDNAKAAQVQTKIILENAGSSLGAIYSAHHIGGGSGAGGVGWLGAAGGAG